MVDDIIITDELGGVQFRKPCDIAFRIMIQRWRLNPAEVMYVGDNITKDFQASQQLGMKCLYYKNINGLYYNNYEDMKMSSVECVEDIYGMIIS